MKNSSIFDKFIGVPWEPEPGRLNVELGIQVRLPPEDTAIIPIPDEIKKEIVSPSLPEFIKANGAMLASDMIFSSDGG